MNRFALTSGFALLFFSCLAGCSSAEQAESNQDDITVARDTDQTRYVGKYTTVRSGDALDVLAIDLNPDGRYVALVTARVEGCKSASCPETGKWKAERMGNWVGLTTLDTGYRLSLFPEKGDTRRYEMNMEFEGGPIVIEKRHLARKSCDTNPCTSARPVCTDQNVNESSLCTTEK